MTQQGRAYLLGGMAVLFWSTVATAFKLGLQWLTPAQLLLFASLSSVLILTVVLLIQGRFHLLSRASKQDWLRSVYFGALNPFIYYLVLLRAYDLLPAQEAQAINYTWALTMSALAVPLLGHRWHWPDMLAAVVCYCGVLVISTRGDVFSLSFSNGFGVILALLSTIIWALYWIYNARDQRDPVLGLLQNFIVAVPMIIIYCLLQGELTIPPWQGFFAAVYVGFFEMGLTFILWLSAMRLTNSTAKISNLIFISPFLSLIFIYLFLDEEIVPATLYGLIMIIFGLLFQQFFKRES